jgi:hypothetical protein
MALPTDIRSLFAGLPDARAARTAQAQQQVREREEATLRQAEERKTQRAALRAELLVAWDWLLGDGQELAAEMRKANFHRLELLGPLDEDGQPCAWQLGARALVLLDDGQLEVVRQDDYRALRYLAHTADELLDIEPPAFTRAFVESVRSGTLWQRVATQLRASTAVPFEGQD